MVASSDRYPKAIRRQLDELAAEAYERELGDHLANLEKPFREWHEDEILASELAEFIHEFHQGPAREVFDLYRSLEPAQVVARAIVVGLFEHGEVPTDVQDAIAREIRRFRARS